MYYGSKTGVAYGERYCMTLWAGQTMREHSPIFAWNDVMAAILKVWRHPRQIENTTPSIDVYLLKGEKLKVSTHTDLKRRSLRLFWRGPPKLKKKNKVSSDTGSVPDPKSTNVLYQVL